MTVASKVHPPPPKNPAKGRKQLKPAQMLTSSGRFSMTVGENLSLKVGVEVLLLQEKSNLA